MGLTLGCIARKLVSYSLCHPETWATAKKLKDIRKHQNFPISVRQIYISQLFRTKLSISLDVLLFPPFPRWGTFSEHTKWLPLGKYFPGSLLTCCREISIVHASKVQTQNINPAVIRQTSDSQHQVVVTNWRSSRQPKRFKRFLLHAVPSFPITLTFASTLPRFRQFFHCNHVFRTIQAHRLLTV